MKRLCALAMALLPAAALAENYLGVLKLPAPAPVFAPSAFTAVTAASDNGIRLKLGYKYSRYFSLEGELSDFAHASDVFSNPANLASAFRSTGFGVDTVATLPIWRLSFYGRMGAYRGERNGMFNTYSTALLADHANRGMRWRYGLGVRYDITRAVGIRAELERYSSAGLGTPFAGDGETDQFTLGVSWRF